MNILEIRLPCVSGKEQLGRFLKLTQNRELTAHEWKSKKVHNTLLLICSSNLLLRFYFKELFCQILVEGNK